MQKRPLCDPPSSNAPKALTMIAVRIPSQEGYAPKDGYYKDCYKSNPKPGY